MKKNFVVKKNEEENTITYMEYEKRKGFKVKPKNKVNIDDMINVNEMIIINPSLIEKLIDKKSERTLNKLFKMLSLLGDEEDDDAGFMVILDEVARFKNLVMSKYIEYMKEEKYKILLKKIEILEEEIKARRKTYITYYNNYEEETRKSRR